MQSAEPARGAARARPPRRAAAGAEGGGGGGEAGGGMGPCGICNAAHILLPWAARPCGHRFCYYCLRSHCQADPGYTCPICLARVEAMQRCGERAEGAEPAVGAGAG